MVENFINKLLILILLISNSKEKIDTSKILFIYFSYSGNTELFSNYIKEVINIDSYKIEPINSYPTESESMNYTAKKEWKENIRPEIKSPLTNITKYKKILLGYPIWNSHIPSIVAAQLLKLNFLGKTIYPFNTHASSGIGNSINDIKLYSIGAIVRRGFDIKGSMIRNNKEDSIKEIRQWLKNNFGYEYNFEQKVNYNLYIILVYILLLYQ